MSSASPDFASRTTNPLFMPLVIVSSLAVVEAVALVILLAMLARQGPSPAPPGVSTPDMAGAAAGGSSPAERRSAEASPPGAAAVPAPPTPPPATAELPHGKRGQRVESAGFAITVEEILYRPASDVLNQVGPEQRYLALLLLVENNTGRSLSFYPVMFRLQDSQSYEYEPLALKMTAPSLEWRHLGNRETVRGYVDFVVPKSSKGLTLIYTHLAQPIRIDLGE